MKHRKYWKQVVEYNRTCLVLEDDAQPASLWKKGVYRFRPYNKKLFGNGV
jgi:hypothetical protein